MSKSKMPVMHCYRSNPAGSAPACSPFTLPQNLMVHPLTLPAGLLTTKSFYLKRRREEVWLCSPLTGRSLPRTNFGMTGSPLSRMCHTRHARNSRTFPAEKYRINVNQSLFWKRRLTRKGDRQLRLEFQTICSAGSFQPVVPLSLMQKAAWKYMPIILTGPDNRPALLRF